MGLKENIEKVVEQRQAEAVKKNLSTKLRKIVLDLGFKIRSSGGGMMGGIGYSQSEYSPDWAWELEEEEGSLEGLPVADLDATTLSGGHYFDGLSSGFNMQILYHENEEFLKVTYDGIMVYSERKGKLEAYIPSPQWEDRLDSLLILAKKRSKMREEKDEDKSEKRRKSRINQVLDYLRRNWGV